ncbi:MAG: DUF4328 domain-containing protein [Dehalococcoidia bacterium]|nr:DUF4328 domain-containing protein [Dehalococcoidia bacterium]
MREVLPGGGRSELIVAPPSLPAERTPVPFESAWPELAATASERAEERAVVDEIRSRAKWAQVAIVLASLASIVFALAIWYEVDWLKDVRQWEQRSRPGGGLIAYGLASTQQPPRELVDRQETVVAFMNLASGWFLTLFFVTAVLLLRWVHGAWRDAITRRVPVPAWTPMWAVGWWFVPFLNLWMPLRVIGGLWRAAHSGFPEAPYYVPSRPVVMWLWWLLTALSVVVIVCAWAVRRYVESPEWIEIAGEPSVNVYIATGVVAAPAAAVLGLAGFLLWATIRAVNGAPRWDPGRVS